MELNNTCRSPAYTQNTVAFALSLLFWIACFYGCWFFFPQWGKTRERWTTMSASERYGLCGLLYSTLHGTIVPIGIVICMTDCGIWGDWLADTCTPMEVVSSLRSARPRKSCSMSSRSMPSRQRAVTPSHACYGLVRNNLDRQAMLCSTV